MKTQQINLKEIMYKSDKFLQKRDYKDWEEYLNLFFIRIFGMTFDRYRKNHARNKEIEKMIKQEKIKFFKSKRK